jgi:hypothetical protein
MFYNPKLEPPKGRFYNITEVEPKWAELYAKQTGPFAPYPTYEEAVNCRWTGPVRFYRDGKMYQGSHVAANHYKPLVGVQCETGINWDTWYACDLDELMNFLHTKYTCLFGEKPRYDEEFAVWSIQVHYDGRCR